MSVSARSARTESTSSSPRAGGSARPCAWPMRPARSASGSCSAAWSSRASASPPPARSPASATTSISTATCCSRTTRGQAWSFATAFSSRRRNPVSVSAKRYLILAEGRALDPHYGKTARGVILYGPDPVIALVDSQAAGAEVEGVPVVATVAEGLASEPPPTTALVGVALAGGRLPPEWRSVLRDVLEAGLDLESGMHEFLGDDAELAEVAHQHGGEI